MKRIETYTREVTVCDICGEDANFHIACEICGKDVCEDCMIVKVLPSYQEIRLCPACKDTDITLYTNKLKEMEMLYEKAERLHEEADAILETLKK